MCGKDPATSAKIGKKLGSPPLVREGRYNSISFNFSVRITPAYAGRTHYLSTNIRDKQDHPRVCGKDAVACPVACTYIGSPPHVREGLYRRRFHQAITRITPACAGRTVHGYLLVSKVQDHPRMCGKDLTAT